MWGFISYTSHVCQVHDFVINLVMKTLTFQLFHREELQLHACNIHVCVSPNDLRHKPCYHLTFEERILAKMNAKLTFVYRVGGLVVYLMGEDTGETS